MTVAEFHKTMSSISTVVLGWVREKNNTVVLGIRDYTAAQAQQECIFNPFLKRKGSRVFRSHWKPVHMGLLKQTLYCELLGQGRIKPDKQRYLLVAGNEEGGISNSFFMMSGFLLGGETAERYKKRKDFGE